MTSINPLHAKNSILARFLISLITIYQRSLSRLLGHNCRFYPSCSCYTKQAIAIHGALKGSMLGIRRLSRCHPWHEGGFDPVPDTNKESRTGTDLERD